MKSRLSVKVFLFTLLLITVCCFTTYSFILQAAPKNYQYDIEDADLELSFWPYEILMTEKEFAYIFFESMSEWIEEQYENEFELHIFQADGQEVSLHDVNQLVGRRITDFDKVEKTKTYTASFSDSDSLYTLLLTRNTAKRTQTEEAIQRTLPVLCIVVLLGSIISAFFYSWYMTSLQEANQKLRADIDMERRLEKQRVEFFAAASHELKTPITIIKGQLQGMLYQVGRYKDRETYLAESLEVADTLEKMVQELLTISRLDTPGYACKKCTLNLSKLVSDRLAAFEDLFMQRDLTVEQSISPDAYILGDIQLLQKALDNLLANAAAYSGAGNQVIIKLWKETEITNLTIENTGVHIPDGDIPKLFEAFYRVDRSRNRQTGGTGLGLYIVKTILDLHGAEIEIANTVQGVIVCLQFY